MTNNAVDLSDARITGHLRAKGLVGPISASFLDEYRLGLGKMAVARAIVEAGGLSSGILDASRDAELMESARRHLRADVAALN
jgi:hypothetical protein